jgi:hypothetical protein
MAVLTAIFYIQSFRAIGEAILTLTSIIIFSVRIRDH